MPEVGQGGEEGKQEQAVPRQVQSEGHRKAWKVHEMGHLSSGL